MTTIAVVPARGGSRRIPRKNVRRLGRHPLVEWTLRAALSAKFVDRVVVSTDDSEVAGISECWPIEVVDRDPRLGEDDVAAVDVVVDACRIVGADEEDAIVMLLPTSPFRSPDHIDAACRLWSESRDGDAGPGVSVVSVTDRSSALRTLRIIGEDGLLEPLRPTLRLVESNGAIQIADWPALQEAGGFHRRPLPYAMDRVSGLDIDEETDWAAAESILARSEGIEEPFPWMAE